MLAYKPLFEQVLAVVQQHGEGRIESSQLCQAVLQMQQKLADLRPTIMVYGIYNAGKSTLINALIGQEQAKVSDRPETDTVTEYQWQGIRLFDTPGIDAPIQHQTITEAHLKQTEVVLFVVSSDGAFDERYIYDHLIRIMKANKPIILVLNTKSVLSEQVETQILAEIGHHLSVICAGAVYSQGIEHIAVVSVNAKSALKAKLEHKSKLLESSRIQPLESRIAEIMQRVGIKESLQSLTTLSVEWLTQIETDIANDITKNDVNGLATVSGEIQRAVQRLNSRAEYIVRSEMLRFEESLKRVLLQATENSTLDSQVNSLITTVLQAIQSQIESLLATFSESVSEKCQLIYSSAPNLALTETSGDSSLSTLDSVAKLAGSLDAKMIKTALVAGKDLGLPILGNTGVKVLGQWASVVGKALPFVVAGFQFLFEIWGNSQAEKQAHERALLVNQKAAELRDGVQKEVLAQLVLSIAHIEQIMQQPLQQQKATFSSTLQMLEKELKIVTELKSEIVALVY